MIGEMDVMDPTGHTRMTWDSDNAAEVENARKTYEEMTKKGYKAFMVKKDGSEGKPMKDFDPTEEKMILIPPLKGG